MKQALIFCVLSIVLACNAQKKQESKAAVQTQATAADKPVDYSIGAPTVIYKTKNDYYDKIPVTLSDDKTNIVSYPAPTDIYYDGKLAYPVKLHDGYILDNRGINKNSVFLNITYEEFSKLTEAPPLSKMMKMIIDKAPFTEIYNCGNRYQYKDVVSDLNKVIDNKELNKFKRIL